MLLLRFLSFIFFYETLCISSPNPLVTRLTDPIQHAEGPTWDSRKNLLYYVDQYIGGVLSYNPETYDVNNIRLYSNSSPVIPSKDDPDVLIVGIQTSVVAIKWNGEDTSFDYKILTNVSQQFPGSRINDGKADKHGRLWFGTMGLQYANGDVKPNEGVLYLIDTNNLEDPIVKIAPVNISNGLTWNDANDKFYYIDSQANKVTTYNYSDESGDIVYDGVAFDFTQYPILAGIPDGMTIDVDNNLWIANIGGGSVIKVNPNTGELLQIVPIPSRDVTSCIWGGSNFETLFVTTSRRTLTDDEKKKWPYAGSVFGVTNLGTKGFQGFFADSFGAFE